MAFGSFSNFVNAIDVRGIEPDDARLEAFGRLGRAAKLGGDGQENPNREEHQGVSNLHGTDL